MKRVIVLVSLLFSLFSLASCGTTIPLENDIANRPDTIEYIVRWDYEYEQSILYSRFGLTYSVDDAVKDTILQTAVSQIEIEYPLESDEDIKQYMWEIYEICIKHKLFSSELVPSTAEKFEGDIWFVSFSVPGSAYDGTSACALVSAKDGHIIYLSTEDIIIGEANKGYGE